MLPRLDVKGFKHGSLTVLLLTSNSLASRESRGCICLSPIMRYVSYMSAGKKMRIKIISWCNLKR